MKGNSRKRHIVKAITWRIVGTCDTILIAWIVSGDPLVGFQIGMAEVFTKLLLYYVHERIWFKMNLAKGGEALESRKRHLAKTVTWRVIGSLDTMIMSWIISGNPFMGLKIGGADVITKMGLYYLHERVWYRINFGLPEREKL